MFWILETTTSAPILISLKAMVIIVIPLLLLHWWCWLIGWLTENGVKKGKGVL